MTDSLAVAIDLERAKMAVERLERENAAMRRQVLETETLTRKNQEHA